MAHFIGYTKGHKGEASRLGTKESGMSVTAASWQGAVDVWLYHDKDTGRDMVRVSLKPWHGAGQHVDLYSGPVGGTLGSVCDQCNEPAVHPDPNQVGKRSTCRACGWSAPTK